jgi:murein DD-endopeptidase MepM/ murein hydrolase activator NlpD
MSLGMPPISPNYGGRGGGGGGSHTSSTGGAGTTSNNPGTRNWNDFKGRDPDLIYAGETLKLPNGETYTVKAGETLSSIAAAKGITVKQLMETNGFDTALLGKNGNGDYFAAGPQPKPGDNLAGGATHGKKFEAPAPAGPNGTYTKEQATTIASQVQQLERDGKISAAEAKKALDLLNQVASDPSKVTSEQTAELTASLKGIETKANGSSSLATNAGMSKEQAEARLKQLTDTGLKNSGLTDKQFIKLGELLTTVKNGGTLSAEDAKTLKELDTRFTGLIA